MDRAPDECIVFLSKARLRVSAKRFLRRCGVGIDPESLQLQVSRGKLQTKFHPSVR